MVFEVIENLNSVVLIVMIFVIYSLLIIIWTKIKKEEKSITIQENNQQAISNIFGQEFIETDSEGTILTYVDYFAKHLFKEHFKIEENIDYISLENNPKFTNNKQITTFCNDMSSTLYSGKKIDYESISKIIRNIEEIVMSEQTKLTEEEKPEFLKYIQGIHMLKKIHANHHPNYKREKAKKEDTNKKIQKKEQRTIEKHKKQIERITKHHKREHIKSKNISSINDLNRIKNKVDNIRKIRN